MTSPDPRGPVPAGVSALLATVFAAIGFFAIAVFGLGVLTVVTDRDLIAVPGLGQAPGAAGMAGAVVAFALATWVAVRPVRPLFRAAMVIALTSALCHLVMVWLGVLVTTSDVVTATAVIGDLVRGGASVVLLVSAALAAMGAVALRRTPSSHRRWHWEEEDEE